MSFYNSSSSTSNNGVLLEISLSEIFLAIKPSEDDVTARTQIISKLKDIVGCVFRIVDFTPEARVPILAVANNRNNIHCDISINNWKGLINSKFLSWITQIDGRFRDMVLLINEWAKLRDINSPKDGTLNSYSLSLLVIFHFQTCEPAIFPPLKDIYAGNIMKDFRGGRLTVTEERNIHETCNANIERFKRNLTNVNKSSLSELFVSFFQKIEDQIDRPENAARAVMYISNLNKISEACEGTYQKLLSACCDKTSVISSLVSREISSKILI
ncbi:hypothetical protein MKX01_027874 [Papaver californicum]|nr:hypothetical protein MKX01_027874 [Papaver californicum]